MNYILKTTIDDKIYYVSRFNYAYVNNEFDINFYPVFDLEFTENIKKATRFDNLQYTIIKENYLENQKNNVILTNYLFSHNLFKNLSHNKRPELEFEEYNKDYKYILAFVIDDKIKYVIDFIITSYIVGGFETGFNIITKSYEESTLNLNFTDEKDKAKILNKKEYENTSGKLIGYGPLVDYEIKKQFGDCDYKYYWIGR